MSKHLSILVILLVTAMIVGCSGSTKTPVTPSSESTPIPAFAIDASEADLSQVLWGAWDVDFNLENMTYGINPDRDLAATYNVTSWIPTPGIVINGYDPGTSTLDVDVTISNPYTIQGHDVRLVIYTDSAGHKLLNDDGWTNMFDIPGGFIGNPFKAYAKEQPNRLFAGQTQYTENLQIHYPPSSGNIRWAITASYPANCFDPYKLDNFAHTPLEDTNGSSCTIVVDVSDWQNDVSQVVLYETTIGGGSFHQFTHASGNEWSIELVNNNGVAAGEYPAIVIAYSVNSGNAVLFDYFTITVTKATEEHGWARNWGGWSADYGRGVAIDHQGNFYCFGSYKSDDFDVNPDPLIDDERGNAGSNDLFLSKFDKDGNWQWAYTWGGTYVDDTDERGTPIDIDDNDNVYFSGRFYYTVDLDPTDGVDTFTAAGTESDAFVTKLSPDGSYQWTKTWGSEETDWGMTVACDGSDYVYIGGIMWGSTDLDPGSGVDMHYLNGPLSIFNWDGYMIKLNPNGDYVWGKHWGGTDSDWIEGVSVDDNSNILIAGGFYTTVDFNPDGTPARRTSQGCNDAYVMKLNPDGVFQWVNAWGSTSYDHAHHAAADSNGNIYVAGNFSETVDFDPDPVGEDLHTSNGSFRFDASISAFTPDGDYLWGGGWGGTERDQAYDIAVDGFDNIFIIGKYQYTADFDITDGEDIRTSAGGEDIFLSVFRPDGERWYTLTFGGESIEEGNSVYATEDGICGFAANFASDTIPIDWNPGPEEYFLVPEGSVDPILVKLMPGGVW